MFLWLSQSGGPQNIPGPTLGLLLPGTGLMKLTLAPRVPSQGRCLSSGCEGSRRPQGNRRGPWACVLEPSQAAARRQGQGILSPLCPARLRVQSFRAAAQHAPPPGPQVGSLLSCLDDNNSLSPRLLCPLLPRSLFLLAT